MRGFVTIITRALSPAIIDWIGIDLPFTFVADPGKSLFIVRFVLNVFLVLNKLSRQM